MKISRLTAVIAALLVLLSVHVGGAASLSLDPATVMGNATRIDEVEEKLRLAFTALNEADEVGVSGAGVSVLTEKLNTAVKLLMEARVLEADGDSSAAAEYASQSLAISEGVREEAEGLRETTSRALFSSRVTLLALAPVVGLIAAVVFYYVYRARRRPGMEKILRMGIRRREEVG